MTETYSTTFNREDIRRVTQPSPPITESPRSRPNCTPKYVDQNVTAIKAVAEEQYLKAVHMRLVGPMVRFARPPSTRHRLTPRAGPANDPVTCTGRPTGDQRLTIILYANWATLTQTQKEAFGKEHLPGWGPSSFDGHYDGLAASTDRQYSSRAYGMERTRYRRPG